MSYYSGESDSDWLENEVLSEEEEAIEGRDDTNDGIPLNEPVKDSEAFEEKLGVLDESDEEEKEEG